MGVIVNLDVMLARRKMASNDLAERIGLSQNNLSRIKTGKIKAIRFSTLGALCRELDCKPGDLLDYIYDETDELDDFEPEEWRTLPTACEKYLQKTNRLPSFVPKKWEAVRRHSWEAFHVMARTLVSCRMAS